MQMLDHALSHFDDGLLFYFSTIDSALSHDVAHIGPTIRRATRSRAAQFAVRSRTPVDGQALGICARALGRDTPDRPSDHGFSTFTRREREPGGCLDRATSPRPRRRAEPDASSRQDAKAQRSEWSPVPSRGRPRPRAHEAYAVGLTALPQPEGAR
jgi:hypothetical protein